MGRRAPAREQAGGRCLILGYDRSDSARRAAVWAARQLEGDGRLVIVHACRPLHAPPLSSAEERHRMGRALVDELLLEGENELLDVSLATEVSDEDPVSALTGAAERHRADGIVVGCQSHSALHKAIGTVTSELLRTSPVPVTVVPAVRSTQSAAAGQPSAGSGARR